MSIEPTTSLVDRYAALLAAHAATHTPVNPKWALLATMMTEVQRMLAALPSPNEVEPEHCPECAADYNEIEGTGEYLENDDQQREVWKCVACGCEWVPEPDSEERIAVLCALSFVQGALWGMGVCTEADLIPKEIPEAETPAPAETPPSGRLLPFPFLATRVTDEDK
jgi:hypothetical protein